MTNKDKPKQRARQIQIVEVIREHFAELEGLAATLSVVASNRTRQLLLDHVKNDLFRTIASLDSVKEPTSFFDPSDPQTAGRLVAVALLAQPRVPFDRIFRSYGGGVYAIYYIGKHPAYAAISGTESPIYVGKADPASPQARTPREQGPRLYSRLVDHRKAIRTVEAHALKNGLPDLLLVSDFECRKLVTATNAQLFAEAHLIDIFKPIWNWDTNVCWGISKHGDTDGRSNSRSPWDVIHPGRVWAMLEKLEDARPPERILQDIANHFVKHPPFTNRDDIIDRFLEAFAQDPLIATSPVTDEEGNLEVGEAALDQKASENGSRSRP
ncbi:MAG: Eco29kI family restriction endonuclease [Phyllobacteriaceae bacterium]|nr:Eco29kI family restriction endonuclease [Phyllobacteriaceae bacterium]